MRYLLPVAVLLGLLVLFAVGLTLDPHKVPSPLIDKPAPSFALPVLDGRAAEQITSEQIKGQAVLVNFWASWCTSCLQEHPLLMELSRSGVKIIGFNYKDTPQDARQWLARHGNPFTLIVQDEKGQAGLDWGVYGAPETFVLDAQAIIRYKQIGPLTEQDWLHKVQPILRSRKSEIGSQG